MSFQASVAPQTNAAASQGKGFPGITAPISTAQPKDADIKSTQELEECLRCFDLFETEDEMNHRKEVLSQINELVQKWVHTMSIMKKFPVEVANQMSGKIFTFGSFRLGVHTKGADIDTLLVAPRHIDRSDFFSSFADQLKEWPTVEYVRPVEDAYVPVIKTKVDGIELDILFSRLALKNIPKDHDLRSVELLRNLEPKCVRSLNGCRVTDDILQLVPNHEAFRLSLRAIKLWAKRKGIYSNALGYLGGVSWAMLVARTCQLYPNAAACTLVHKFFLVFSQWPWPKPVLLRHASEDTGNLGFPVWDPRTQISDRFHLMPIITPSYPQQNSTFNVTTSTRTIMTNEFCSALDICDKIQTEKIQWSELFEPTIFFSKYKHFIVLMASNEPEWIGLVESKIRLLVQHLERHKCIKLAHITPDAYNRVISLPLENSEPGESGNNNEENKEVDSETLWFIGLQFDRAEAVNIDLTSDIRTFITTVRQSAIQTQRYKEEMRIDIKHVKRKELHEYLPSEVIKKASKNIKDMKPSSSPSRMTSNATCSPNSNSEKTNIVNDEQDELLQSTESDQKINNKRKSDEFNQDYVKRLKSEDSTKEELALNDLEKCLKMEATEITSLESNREVKSENGNNPGNEMPGLPLTV